MTDIQKLPAFGPGGLVNVVVEASRNTVAKCKYDSSLKLFVFGRPLPRGLFYPFDWGFIPATRGEDGDPLDAMVLHEAACPVGCLIRCQPLALLRIEQRQKGKTQRNDRLLFRPAADKTMKQHTVLTSQVKRELEQFFEGVVLDTGKSLRFEGWRGPSQVLSAVRKGARLAQAD